MAKKSEPPAWYPLFLDLRGIAVLMVGGGAVALRKARGLAGVGARLTVVARTFVPGWRVLGAARLVRRAFRVSDLRGQRLVFAATDDLELNRRIARLAGERQCWVNVAAPPEAGDLALPAVVRRGRLTLAVSTAGVSASVSRFLRQRLSRQFDRAWAEFLDLLASRRGRVKETVHDAGRRRRLLRTLGDPKWVELIRARGVRAAGEEMDALIARSGKVSRRS